MPPVDPRQADPRQADPRPGDPRPGDPRPGDPRPGDRPPGDPRQAGPPPTRLRWAWWLFAYACLGLGLIGIVVPGLPTVPFVLLAAYAAARGSQRLHGRLLAHARFGPLIRDWQAHGAVSRRAKVLAVTMMAACAALLFVTAPRWWMAVAGSAVMAIVGAWLWSRPEPPRG